jgi:hypothetical protein
MQFLRLLVRQNWQVFREETRAENLRLWRTLQSLVILSSVLFLGVDILPADWRSLELPWLLASVVVYFLITALFVLRNLNIRKIYLALGFTLLAVMVFVAWYTSPSPFGASQQTQADWLVLVSPVILAGSAFLLANAERIIPDQLNRLGLNFKNLPYNFLLGVLAGGTLALHLLVTTLYVPNVSHNSWTNWRLVFWTVVVQAGLVSLGEELLFRGVGFSLLDVDLNLNFWQVAAQITLLNSLVYLVQILHSPNLIIGLLILFYRATLSLINVYLRYRQDSLIPCWTSNLIFSVVLRLLLP